MSLPPIWVIVNWVTWVEVLILVAASVFALQRRRQTGDRRMTFLMCGLVLLALARIEGLVANYISQQMFAEIQATFDQTGIDEGMSRVQVVSTINVLLGQALTLLGIVFLALTVADRRPLGWLGQRVGRFWREGSA